MPAVRDPQDTARRRARQSWHASVTGAFLLIVVLVGTDVLLSLVKRSSRRLDRLLEGQPLVILP